MAALGLVLAGRILHHDQADVYTNYPWLRAILPEDGLRVSYSENAQKAIPR